MTLSEHQRQAMRLDWMKWKVSSLLPPSPQNLYQNLEFRNVVWKKILSFKLETRKLYSLFDFTVVFNDRSCTLHLKIHI
jgi:hypothetical protein